MQNDINVRVSSAHTGSTVIFQYCIRNQKYPIQKLWSEYWVFWRFPRSLFGLPDCIPDPWPETSPQNRICCEFLIPEKLCHKHGIFSTGNTDRNAVTRFDKLILIYCFCEFAPDALTELLRMESSTSLQMSTSSSPLHRIQKPCNISAFQTYRIHSFLFQSFGNFHAETSTAAADH